MVTLGVRLEYKGITSDPRLTVQDESKTGVSLCKVLVVTPPRLAVLLMVLVIIVLMLLLLLLLLLLIVLLLLLILGTAVPSYPGTSKEMSRPLEKGKRILVPSAGV